ncbi:MAG: hypothetical protein Q4B03_05075 [Lachnospiraceae bacterium]|nr:hypothetical protein [Lachnospiraceae bacterium]
MKKKLTAAVLGLAFAAGIAGFGVTRVIAEPDTSAAEEISAVSETDLPKTDEEERFSENVEADSETDTEKAAVAEESENEEERSGFAEDETDPLGEETVEEETLTGMIVHLESELEQRIESIQVSTFAGTSYSGNLLPEGQVLSAENTVDIGIPEEFQDPELGMYNIRIRMEDGSEIEIPFVPLLEQSLGIVYSDGSNILVRVRDERLEAEEEQVSITEILQREEEFGEARSEALAAEVE